MSRDKHSIREHNTGKHFERLTAAVQRKLDAGSVVTWDDKIAGRQIDVSVRGHLGTSSILVIIECRDYGANLGISHVDGLDSVQRETQANKAILVTRTGYSTEALAKASALGIDTCTLGPAQIEDYPQGTIREYAQTVIPIGIALDDLEVELDDGRRIACDHADKIEGPEGRSAFLDRFVKGWLGSNERCHPMGKKLHLALDPHARLLRDNECPVVTSIHCVPYETRGTEVRSLWNAPLDWVFRKVQSDGTRTEEQFLRFSEIDTMAKSLVRARPVS